MIYSINFRGTIHKAKCYTVWRPGKLSTVPSDILHWSLQYHPHLLRYSRQHFLYRTNLYPIPTYYHLIPFQRRVHKPLRWNRYLPQTFTNEVIFTFKSNALHQNIIIINRANEDPSPVYRTTKSVFLQAAYFHYKAYLLQRTQSHLHFQKLVGYSCEGRQSYETPLSKQKRNMPCNFTL